MPSDSAKNLFDLLPFDELKTASVLKNEHADIRLITLEAGAELATHSSPVDAAIVVLEGRMMFTLPEGDQILQKGDFLSFGAKVQHAARAEKNCRFLLIR